MSPSLPINSRSPASLTSPLAVAAASGFPPAADRRRRDRPRVQRRLSSVWGYTTDDFSDELFSTLTTPGRSPTRRIAHLRREQGYDLVDDNGCCDWWGYCWMILAEKRGLLTPENRAAARAAIEEKYLTAPERDRRHRRALIICGPSSESAHLRGVAGWAAVGLMVRDARSRVLHHEDPIYV